MKKTIFLIAAAMIAAISITGCGNTATQKNTSPSSTDAQATESAQQKNEALDNLSADADKNVDMEKLEGTKATVDTATESKDGAVGDTDVTIEDAKVIKYNDQDVIVVSFNFKNKSGQTDTFSALEQVDAEQDGAILNIATVVGVEGVDCNTLTQLVDNGKSITVQKAFRLHDTTTPVTIMVNSPQTVTESSAVYKTFNIAQ